MSARTGITLATALAFLLLAAAGQCPAQEPATAAPAAKEAAAPGEAGQRSVTEVLEDENFHYNSAGRRDPFKSLLALQEKKKDVTLLPPIQQLDLGAIKVTGIIMDEKEGPRAMIKAPNGRTFIVKKGTIIGKNEGEVIEVSLQGFRVVEKYVDFMGRETLKEVFVKARPEK